MTTTGQANRAAPAIEAAAQLSTDEQYSPAWFLRYNARAMGVMGIDYCRRYLVEQCLHTNTVSFAEAVIRRLADLRPHEFKITVEEDGWTEVHVYENGEELI